jgi:hypothetical protein
MSVADLAEKQSGFPVLSSFWPTRARTNKRSPHFLERILHGNLHLRIAFAVVITPNVEGAVTLELGATKLQSEPPKLSSENRVG